MHAAGWMGKGPGRESGCSGGGRRGGGDILPARAVPDGRAMKFRSGLPTAAAPRSGRAGGERMNPLKRDISRTAGTGRGLGE